MGATKGRGAAVIAAGLLMAACIGATPEGCVVRLPSRDMGRYMEMREMESEKMKMMVARRDMEREMERRERETMARDYLSRFGFAAMFMPMDVFRDRWPPEVVFRPAGRNGDEQEFRATFPDGSSLVIGASPCPSGIEAEGLCVLGFASAE